MRDSELNKRQFDINLKSVTEQSSLEEFLNTAEMAGTDFESERLNLRFVKPQANIGILSREEQIRLNEVHKKNVALLRIPRRPEWKHQQQEGNDRNTFFLILILTKSFSIGYLFISSISKSF